MASTANWHVRPNSDPVRLVSHALPSEAQLESWIYADPSIVSSGIAPVRRQANLGGKFLDLLTIEQPGIWTIIELKKVTLERVVVAQAIDYATRISAMSYDEFASLVKADWDSLTPETQELVSRTLAQEELDGERDVRIILAGVGVSDDLANMVTFLNERYNFPLRVCTLRAFAAPDGSGFILQRETSEDVELPATTVSLNKPYDERLNAVRQAFEAKGQSSQFAAITESITDASGLYARPYKRTLMITPAMHKGRCLAWLTPETDGIDIGFYTEAVHEFFPSADTTLLDAYPQRIKLTTLNELQEWLSVFVSAVSPQ